MRVLVGKKLYGISKKEYRGLLETAKEQVPRGIYAIEKGNYAELKNIKCSTTQLKAQKRLFEAQGFKVYANG